MIKIEGMTPLLNVESVDRSLEFYCETLGFEVEQVHEMEGEKIWAALRFGPTTLMINAPDFADSQPRSARPSYAETVFYYRVPDIELAHSWIKECGGPVGEIQRMPYGVDEFSVRDPDGYELAFAAATE